MNLTRREFSGHLAKGGIAIVLAGDSVFLVGCGSLPQEIENWVPVGIASMNSIELVLKTNGFPLSASLQAIFNDIIAALNAIKSAAIEYASATPPPVGTLQKLQDAIKAVTDQLATFLQQLALPGGNIVNLIVGLAQIIISTILAFANQLPPAPAGAKVFRLSASYQVANTAFNVSPKERTRRKFRHDWNATLDVSKQAGLYVPGKAYLHGWF